MKATTFQKPLEFNLTAEGESWNQGDPVKGALTVKNHGGEPMTLEPVRVHLARGELKKVRAKSPGAFEILASAELPARGPLGPGASASFDWKFTPDRNCQISDTAASLFLLYGVGDATEKLGQLQLTFKPEPMFLELLKALEIGHRFVRKGEKSNKGFVEFKLAPPDAKGMAMIDQLVVGCRYDGDAIEARYVFSLKRVQATAASVETKKEKREVRQKFRPDEYRTPSGRPNHDALEAAVRDALGSLAAPLQA